MTVTLEEVAAAREEWRAAVERARERVEELKAPYHAAFAELARAETELARTELALGTAKRSHFIAAAVEALGVETSDPPAVILPQTHGLPKVYELTAIGADGTGLYLSRPERSHRYQGKSWALRMEHVPEAVREIVAVELGYGAKAQAIRELGYSASAGGEIRPVHGSDELMEWQERGKGDFGDGSGSMKPVRPPSGGRWRWLKVQEQSELEGG